MSDFRSTMLEAINTYKVILKKTLSRSSCASKVRELGLKRQNLKAASDTELHQLGSKIVAAMKKDLPTAINLKTTNAYLGTKEFLRHLEKLLRQYRLRNDRVTNQQQNVACALVAAIQLIAATISSTLNQKALRQLYRYRKLVLAHGTDEQKRMWNEGVKSHTSTGSLSF